MPFTLAAKSRTAASAATSSAGVAVPWNTRARYLSASPAAPPCDRATRAPIPRARRLRPPPPRRAVPPPPPTAPRSPASRERVRDPPSEQSPARGGDGVGTHQPQERAAVRALRRLQNLELAKHVRRETHLPALRHPTKRGREAYHAVEAELSQPVEGHVAGARRLRGKDRERRRGEKRRLGLGLARAAGRARSASHSATAAATAAAAPPSTYPLPAATRSTRTPPRPFSPPPYIAAIIFAVSADTGSTSKTSAGATRNRRASSSGRIAPSTNSSCATSPVLASTAATPTRVAARHLRARR